MYRNRRTFRAYLNAVNYHKTGVSNHNTCNPRGAGRGGLARSVVVGANFRTPASILQYSMPRKRAKCVSHLTRELYSNYIVFASRPKTHVKHWEKKNREFMLKIIEHASQWKGSRAPPDMHILQRLCTVHEVSCTSKIISKTALIQNLIQKFVRIMQEQDAKYVLPQATTEVAKQIFCAITRNVDAKVDAVRTIRKFSARDTPDNLVTSAQFANLNGGNSTTAGLARLRSRRASSPVPSTKRSIPTLGTQDFDSVREYESRMLLVRQHFLRASPCVRIELLNIRQRLVYEEWIIHRRSTGATERTEYRCRRHAKPRRQRIVHAGTLFLEGMICFSLCTEYALYALNASIRILFKRGRQVHLFI